MMESLLAVVGLELKVEFLKEMQAAESVKYPDVVALLKLNPGLWIQTSNLEGGLVKQKIN